MSKVSCGSGLNGHHTPSQTAKGKKRNDVPIDPAAMYESLKNRIAALEEEEVLEEEEERRFGTFPCMNLPPTFAYSGFISGGSSEIREGSRGECCSFEIR